MHNGSVKTLEEAVAHEGTVFSAQDRSDLIEFLRTLTDEELLHDSRFSRP
jgi:cytochrome c peroxidase